MSITIAEIHADKDINGLKKATLSNGMAVFFEITPYTVGQIISEEELEQIKISNVRP